MGLLVYANDMLASATFNCHWRDFLAVQALVDGPLRSGQALNSESVHLLSGQTVLIRGLLRKGAHGRSRIGIL